MAQESTISIAPMVRVQDSSPMLPQSSPQETTSGHSKADSSGASNSTANAGLSLEYFESLALSANPSLSKAAAAVAAARGGAIQAGLALNPIVGYEGQQIGSNGLAEQHGLLVGQEFRRHEKRNLSREVATREMQMASSRWAAQQVKVLTDVRSSFYRSLRAQEQVELTNELLQISKQAFAAVDSLAKAKEVSATDVLQAQIEVDVAQIATLNANNLQLSSWRQLSAVTGQTTLQLAPLSGDLFGSTCNLDFDSSLACIRSESPEIREAWRNIERARFNLQRQIVEPRPNLSVQGLYNFVDNGIGGRQDAGLVVSVPVPVWDRNQGAIQQARFQVVEAERSLEQLELGLQQRLAPAFEKYANAKNLVVQYNERILPAASEVLAKTQITFEAGEIGFLNLLLAQRTYRQYQVAYLDAAEALRVSEAEINGMLLSGSLQTSR
jgi:cobalt-zinc-cadmium efflux system outer membrane protein